MRKFLIMIPIALVLSSCETTQPGVRSKIQSFHELNTVLDKQLYITSRDEGMSSSIEFRVYREKFRSAFSERGFNVVDNIEDSNLIAFIDYGIGDENIRTSYVSMPVWGPTGGGTSTSTTIYGGGVANTTTNTTPNYGVTGSRTIPVSYSQYDRFVTIDIFTLDTEEGVDIDRKVYESTLKSSGYCSILSEVMDEFIMAIFSNFPNTNGQVDIVQGADFNC